MRKGGLEPSEKQSPLERISAFIVDKRKAFYLMYIGIAIFCVFSSGWTAVNDDLTSYLPDTTETRQGLTIMDEEFVTFGTSRVMVDNISCAQAEGLARQAETVEGVRSVEFDGTENHYANGAALFSVTYDGAAGDPVSLAGLEGIKALLEGYDVYITGDSGDSASASLDAEMRVVMVVAVVIILLVLLFTSHTYMEIPVLLMTFGAAALMNKGTNFIFGEISFVSNSVAVVLQLALAIDYAIILCHRYTEERERLEAREAVVAALSKAIPEISGSSMTTLSGLGAMCFMQFGIGKDLGLVLMKAIVLSLLAVFTLMPGLLLSFSGLIDRTHHRSFVPRITGWGRLAVKTRFIMPPLFVVLLIGGFIFANRCPYAYGQTGLTTIRKNDAQIAQAKVNGTFGRVNTLAVLVPQGDYEQEGRLLRELERMPETDTVLGLANVDAMGGYAEAARDSSQQLLNQVSEFTDENIGSINTLTADITNALDKISPALDGLSEAGGQLERLSDQLGGALDGLDSAVDISGRAVREVRAALDNLRQAQKGLSAAAGRLKQALDTLYQAVFPNGPDGLPVRPPAEDLEAARASLRQAFNALRDAGDGTDSALSRLERALLEAQPLSGALKDVLDDLQGASGSSAAIGRLLRRAFDAIGGAVDDLTRDGPAEFIPLGDEFHRSSGGLFDALGGLSGEMAELNGVLQKGNNTLTADLRSVSRQFNVVFDVLLGRPRRPAGRL